ncbi:protein LBH-like [Pygocentrus nattereri]|uniref:protein LBH-like n=1 Tax=Pygocentrus nattereri TaxID=42514 RepID=UPI0008147CAB|nr:protein LBH-like [Pygocentrus nattereri]
MMASMASGLQDSSIEELHLQRRGQRVPYQIFPDSEEDSEVLQSPAGQRGRLPSIVVDPTQVSEEERGRLLWSLHRHTSTEEDDDSFQEQEATQNDESNQEEHGNAEGNGEEREAHIKHSSAAVQPGLLDHSRLTPPQSPTAPDIAPPCFRG